VEGRSTVNCVSSVTPSRWSRRIAVAAYRGRVRDRVHKAPLAPMPAVHRLPGSYRLLPRVGGSRRGCVGAEPGHEVRGHTAR